MFSFCSKRIDLGESSYLNVTVHFSWILALTFDPDLKKKRDHGRQRRQRYFDEAYSPLSNGIKFSCVLFHKGKSIEFVDWAPY